MGIQGMELCAMAVVVLLFIAVLKQFGILEPISMEGIVWSRPRCPRPGPAYVGREPHALRLGTPSSAAPAAWAPERWPGTKGSERSWAGVASKGTEPRCLRWV